jgi:periplasmic divalent cation tolerance protein
MYIIIFVTASNKKEASSIAKTLLDYKLVACVNIIDKIESVFWWQGKIDRAKEVLLLIKSKREKLNKIIRLVKSMHSYQLPEIIALPIIGGNEGYLKWISDSVR